MRFFDLLDALPEHISRDPRAYPVVEITYDGTCRMMLSQDEGELVLVVSGGTGQTTTLALADYATITALATAINALTGFTASTLDATLAALLPDILVDVDRLIAEDGRLYAATSVLYFLMRLLHSEVGGMDGRRMLAIGQLNIFTAGGGWLDMWGRLYGVYRYPEESDVKYRRRIVWTVALPRCDNRAIEELLRRGLGIDARVLDEASDIFYTNDPPPDLYRWYTLPAAGRCFAEFSGCGYLGTASAAGSAYVCRTPGSQHTIETYKTFTTASDVGAMAVFGGKLYVAVGADVYDASSWTVVRTLTANVVGMVAAIGELWALAADGTVDHYDGASWAAGPNTILVTARVLATYGSTIVAGGQGGSGPLVEEYAPGGPSWAQLGSNVPSATVYSLAEYSDGLRAGLDTGKVSRYIDPLWGDEYSTGDATEHFAGLCVYDGRLYGVTAAGTTPALHDYGGTAWAKTADLIAGDDGVALAVFSEIYELVVMVDAVEQQHYFRAVKSGQDNPSLLNDATADSPALGIGHNVYAFRVEADIPEDEEGDAHTFNQLVAAVTAAKAAGTVFRVVDTSVGKAEYPTPAIDFEWSIEET